MLLNPLPVSKFCQPPLESQFIPTDLNHNVTDLESQFRDSKSNFPLKTLMLKTVKCTVIDSSVYCQTTVGNVTQPKTVLSAKEKFTVC